MAGLERTEPQAVKRVRPGRRSVCDLRPAGPERGAALRGEAHEQRKRLAAGVRGANQQAHFACSGRQRDGVYGGRQPNRSRRRLCAHLREEWRD